MVMYYQPTTLAEALKLKAERSVQALAGGTDIYPAKATRAGWGHRGHADILDISRVPGLRGISREGQTWRIGALTTWTDIAGADLPPLFDGLKAAAREVGGVQIQNRGTIAGNICNASPAADGAPCLLALDAHVEVQSQAGTRIVPLTQFLDGYRHTTLAGSELVTAVVVPARPGRGAFLKLGARKYLVISIVMAASVLDIADDGTIRDARVAVGACSPVALRLDALERHLCGRPISAPADELVLPQHLADIAPIDDVRASGAYRRHAALQVVRDVLAAYQAPHREAA